MATSAENIFASDEYIQNICDLCSEDNQRIEAKAFCTVCMQYLCEGCHKAHNRANASKHHNCLTGNEMPADQSRSKLIPRCKDHPEQVIDIFCCDHRVVCCTTCKVFNHSRCKKLDSIYDLAPTSKDDVKMKLVGLKSMLNEFGRLEDVNEVLISEVELQKDDLIRSVRGMRQRIDKHLDKLEKEMIAKISKDLKNEVSQLTRRKDEIMCIKTELRKTVTEFEDIQKTGSDHQKFVMSTVAEENLQKYTSIMDAISEEVLPEVTLHINNQLKNFEHHVQSFGDLEVKKSQMELRRLYDDRVAVYLTEVDVSYSTSTNTETAKVNAVEVVPDGGLLICDGANSKIKLFDSSYHFVTDVSLSSTPYSMIFDQGNIIIALPVESCLQTMGIKDSKELKIKSKIKTDTDCYKLVSCGREIIAVAADDLFVYLNLMTANGRIVRCIRKEPDLGGLLSDFRDISISFDEKIVYVTDQKNGCIGLSIAGEVLFVYKEPGMGVYPGVCSDPDGWVYVACSDEDKVVMLGNKGQKKKDLIQHTGIRPTFMTYCPEANRLFLKRDGIGKICVFVLI